MRRFFRLLFRVLILAMVFLASTLVAMRMAIHGREVAVPKIVSLSQSDAERTAFNNGLLLEVENRFYSNDLPENRVLSQLPPPGEKVRRGTHVRVALSLGRQKMVIPNVIGQSQRAAEINIGRRGLEIGSVSVATLPGFPPDQVVAQSPPPNAEGVASPKVNLLVSAPPDDSSLYFMPDFVGRSLDDATRAIAASPMKLGKTVSISASGTGRVASKNPAVVVKQTPASGQKIPAGTTIIFEVKR